MEIIIREYGKMIIASLVTCAVIALLVIGIKNIYVHRFVYAKEEQNMEMTAVFANSLKGASFDISFNRLCQNQAYDISQICNMPQGCKACITGIYRAEEGVDAYWTLPNELENIYRDGQYVFNEPGIYKIYIRVWNEEGGSREGYGNVIVN
ncbi:MAG: hypothetical protein IJ655_04965 [Lachnospiraceae bacterium]|nr:hypothetical protein [Lachnospiraceae bacterium]